MSRQQYAEVLEDDFGEARERERNALEQSIAIFHRAESQGASAQDRIEAILFANKLWSVMVEDLANPENSLPHQLRAQIVSIGIWVLRETEALRSDPARSFADIVAVSEAIRDGLL